MANRIESVLVVDQLLAPSTALDPIVMPVNPLSFIRLSVRALNNTVTLTNFSMLAQLMSFITNIELKFKGHTLFGGSLTDLAVMNALLHGHIPVQNNLHNTDNDVRVATFLLSLSRILYWREECFPATRNGELTLHITSGVAVAGLDNFSLHIETVELLGATPRRFLKYTTQAKTFSTTGQNDLDLPVGNPILGILVFGTTVPTGASRNATAREMKILIDNIETDYSLIEWDGAHGMLGQRIKEMLAYQGHFHQVNAAGAGSEDTTQPETTDETLENYAYLDFDPLRDGSYVLPTEGENKVQLRVTANVADSIRILPLEMFPVESLAMAPRPAAG